jgi:hypothetical protein
MTDFSAFVDLAQTIKCYLDNHKESSDLIHLVRAKEKLHIAEIDLSYANYRGAYDDLGDAICELFILWSRAREEAEKCSS